MSPRPSGRYVPRSRIHRNESEQPTYPRPSPGVDGIHFLHYPMRQGGSPCVMWYQSPASSVVPLGRLPPPRSKRIAASRRRYPPRPHTRARARLFLSIAKLRLLRPRAHFLPPSIHVDCRNFISTAHPPPNGAHPSPATTAYSGGRSVGLVLRARVPRPLASAQRYTQYQWR